MYPTCCSLLYARARQYSKVLNGEGAVIADTPIGNNKALGVVITSSKTSSFDRIYDKGTAPHVCYFRSLHILMCCGAHNISLGVSIPGRRRDITQQRGRDVSNKHTGRRRDVSWWRDISRRRDISWQRDRGVGDKHSRWRIGITQHIGAIKEWGRGGTRPGIGDKRGRQRISIIRVICVNVIQRIGGATV